MARHYLRLFDLRLFALSVRTTALACAASLFLIFAGAERTPAHEGHDHAEDAPPVAGAASPRVVATSETYQFVGIAEGEVLVIYVDRAEDNTPVTTATIDVSLDGESFKAELQEKSATYEVTAPLLRKAGSYEVLVTLSDGGAQDLLVGTLRIPTPSGQGGNRPTGVRQVVVNALASSAGRTLLVSAGILLLVGAAAGGAVLSGRRKIYILPAAIIGLVLTSVGAWAHEGHDHGPDLSVSTGNSPSRRPDGSLFVPKPTQRLLEVRTRTIAVESRTRTVRFNGRIVANPNRSGVVQSTLQGRYEAPEGGVPPLGARVKAGDMLGRASPAFQSIDSSDMAQTLGTLDQEISLNRRKLVRQEQLLTTNAVAKATVEDTRIQLEGLEKRRRELLAAKLRPEDLRAPVDGVIAATRVVAGQVVGPSDQLFQIIDPGSLLVEALVFDQINPDAVDEATAMTGSEAAIKLKFLGRSRALQQQYSIMQFKIVETAVPLNAGAPVTVVASSGERVTGIVLPRAALVQAPNGQTVVFSHKEPEVFVPRPVRFEAFDGENVLVTGGIAAGEKVVVRNAPLLNQVR
jgi:cobalt-zinc-cadmium efflux system membrane fusion protein